MSYADKRLKSLMADYQARCAVAAAERQRQLKQEYLERRGGA